MSHAIHIQQIINELAPRIIIERTQGRHALIREGFRVRHTLDRMIDPLDYTQRLHLAQTYLARYGHLFTNVERMPVEELATRLDTVLALHLRIAANLRRSVTPNF